METLNKTCRGVGKFIQPSHPVELARWRTHSREELRVSQLDALYEQAARRCEMGVWSVFAQGPRPLAPFLIRKDADHNLGAAPCVMSQGATDVMLSKSHDEKWATRRSGGEEKGTAPALPCMKGRLGGPLQSICLGRAGSNAR